MRTHQTQDNSTADGSHNLRDTDGSVKQTEISTHVTISLQSIGNKGERHRQHGCPTGTNHQERNKLQILVMQERYQGKTHTTDNQTDSVCHLRILKLRENDSPDNTTYRLYGKENAHPVACLLKCFRSRVGRIPYGFSDGSRRIIPEIKETSPAEELNQSHLPEGRWRLAEQSNPTGLVFRSLSIRILHTSLFTLRFIILRILLWIPLLHLHRGVDNTENQDSRTDIERPDDRIRNHTLLSIILDTEEGKEEWEDISSYRTGIAEETLDRVSLCLLFFIYHIAYQHLERLHRHVDARIEEHQRYQSEEHRTAYGQSERTGIRQQAHHQDGNRSTHKEIRDAATEAAPRLIAQRAHDRLYQDSHQWRENPEITQVVWVSTQRCKDSGDVGALQGVGNLYSEKSEAQVPELPET